MNYILLLFWDEMFHEVLSIRITLFICKSSEAHSLTSPSHLRSAPLHLRPPHQEYCLPESPRTRPQMGAGLCRGWRSGHPAESHDWGWWPCEMTLMNPVWKQKKNVSVIKQKSFH